MIWALVLGVGYGLGRGLAPGPALALVLATRARGGGAAALPAAVGPIASEGAFLAVALASVGQFSPRGLAVVGLLGALFSARLAWDTWNDAPTVDPPRDAAKVKEAKRVSPFQRGLVVGALSVYAAIFWFTVAGPVTVRLHDRDGLGAGIAFAALALGGAIAVRVAAAYALGGPRRLAGYRVLLRATAITYGAFGVLIAVEAVRLAV